MKRLAQAIKACARLVSKAARFIRREPARAFLALRMATWVAVLTVLVKLFPLPRVMALLTPERVRVQGSDPKATMEMLARLLDTLLATDCWFLTPICWKRAPVLYRYLALYGIESRVVFGVRKGGGDLLDGHAWLEADGRPLLEATAPDYTVTFSFPR